MKQERIFPKIKLTKKGTRWVRSGHPWVYGSDIESQDGECTRGEICDVFSDGEAWMGAGLYSDKSKISVRLLSRNANDTYDEAFFRRRLEYALDYRFHVMGEDVSACRLVFGEADGLPGLTVDRYNDILVTQILSYGMDLRKDVLFSSLRDLLLSRGVKISGIFERNDVALRELEGLTQNKGWYTFPGEEPVFPSPVTEITENGVKYLVDVENGQKTGFFLDQKYNRRAVSRLAKGMTVLDCFTHTGSFALNAAMGGASHVTAVDISEEAVEMARKNAVQNGLESRMDFLACDVFDLLPSLPRGKYNFIILDPPAFTKSRKTVHNAEKGYKEINFRAMKALPRGGYLATCSCSHFMEEELFVKMLRSAASDAGVELKQIEARQQAPDHPILWNVPETSYLKFYIFQIV